MALKDILVHLDTGPHAGTRLAAAVAFARRHNAHLTGLCVVHVPDAPYFYGTEGGGVAYGGAAVVQMVEQMRNDAVAACAPIETAFRDAIAREGIEGEWRLTEGRQSDILALHARYADLTIVGQPNPTEVPSEGGREGTVITPLLSGGRPLLAIPYAGTFPVVGDHVLVAWNASREAARAVNDAMPILEKAQRVTVLAVNPRRGIRGHGDIPAADIALHLARHGVRAEATHTVSNDVADGAVLLSYAADIAADLIVAGAYGHSRVREVVFGGVTRTLIAEMTVPVFMAH